MNARPTGFHITLVHQFLFSFLTLFLSTVQSAEIPDEARQHISTGVTTFQNAVTPEDFQNAVDEIRQATRLAPDWAEAWYSLGIIQEAVEDYAGAINSFNKYLKLSINAPDQDIVTERIDNLEDLLAIQIKTTEHKPMVGIWCSESTHPRCNYRLSAKNNMFIINSDARQFNATTFQRYEGTISEDGTITGHYRVGRSNIESCNGNPDLLSIPLTGKLVNKQTLHLTYTLPVKWPDRGCQPPDTTRIPPEGSTDAPSRIDLKLTIE